MALFEIAALLSFGTASAAIQGNPPAPAVQPAPDTVEERRQLRTFSMCLAASRSSWARNALSKPYLGEEQASIASRALAGRDGCMAGEEMEMTFRTSTMVGSLAEHFVRAELGGTDFNRVAQNLSTVEPLNVSEDFALCIAARDPAAARDLALSDPGSATEAAAVAKLARFVSPCMNPGERLTVDMQALRALTSVALYRGMRTVVTAGN